MIGFVDHIVDDYLVVSRVFAVCLELQSRELAPLFKAIFAAAPTGYDAAQSYLKDWNEILW